MAYKKFIPPPLPANWDRFTPRDKAKYGYWLQMEAVKDRPQKYLFAVQKKLAQTDLYFLFLFVLGGKKWADNDWTFNRCREIQKNPNGFIDLWCREHLKSSLITFALTIFDLLNDPELTVGIFSNTRPIAKTFLRQIMMELKRNEMLKALFPEIFYAHPEVEAPKFSEDDGIILKRQNNPKESSIEAWGLVESMPIGRHFDIRVYDDVVTPTSVNTPEMITKTTNAFSISDNLGKEGGHARIIGTFYSEFDTYNWIIEQGIAIPRIYPATENGEIDGKLVFFSPEYYAKKRRNQTTYDFNCQMLLRPKREESAGFNETWWQTWPNANHEHLNLHIIVDPAQSKSKAADSTAMWLIGYGADKNYYAVDFICDKLSLTEKADILFGWHREYKIAKTHYEKVALQSDIQHIEDRMERENFRFKIEELHPGRRNKASRINALEPLFRARRIYFMPQCFRTNYQGDKVDMIKLFKNNEFKPWPIVSHDDGLDCLAYINDIAFTAPGQMKKKRRKKTHNVVPFRATGTGGIYGGY